MVLSGMVSETNWESLQPLAVLPDPPAGKVGIIVAKGVAFKGVVLNGVIPTAPGVPKGAKVGGVMIGSKVLVAWMVGETAAAV